MLGIGMVTTGLAGGLLDRHAEREVLSSRVGSVFLSLCRCHVGSRSPFAGGW
jgi:hypothetical protein